MSEAIVPTSTFTYSVVRFMPDPIREEFVNIGLLLTDEAGSYSRFEFNHHMGPRLAMLGAEGLRPGIVSLFEDLKDSRDLKGHQLIKELQVEAPLTAADLGILAGEFRTMVRFSIPRVVLSDDPQRAFDSLYARLIRRPQEVVKAPLAIGREPEAERRGLRDGFVRELKRLPNFSDERIKVGEPFRGLHFRHWVDVVVIGSRNASAFAHALPMNAVEVRDAFLHRATVLEAAADADPDGIRLALYSDPEADRVDLLRESLELLAQRNVEAYRRDEIGLAARRFEETLLLN